MFEKGSELPALQQVHLVVELMKLLVLESTNAKATLAAINRSGQKRKWSL